MNLKGMSRVAFKLAKSLNNKMDMKDIRRTIQDIFTPNFGELDKNFSDLKGTYTPTDSDGYSNSKITGLVKKEWVDTYFGKDIDLKKLEKQLTSRSYSGPGQSYENTYVTVKPKGKDTLKFEIDTTSGLDI